LPSAPLIAEAQPASPASARDLVRVARHGGSAAELLAALRAAAQDCLAADSAVVTPAAALAVAGPAALVCRSEAPMTPDTS
jgi:hypothetical protein